MSDDAKRGCVSTVTVDPLNHPGKRGARLWFLMMESSVVKSDCPEGRWVLEIAKELERNVDAGTATDAEQQIFREAYSAFRAKLSK